MKTLKKNLVFEIISKTMILFLILVIHSAGVRAQVTIGSGVPPAKAALLELKDKDANPTTITDNNNITSETGGLLMPRVKLVNVNTLEPFIATSSADWTDLSRKTRERHAGLLVYNIEVQSGVNGFKQGVYEWDGAKWRMLQVASKSSSFFYMPSFNLPIGAVANGITFDLYAEYERQFKSAGNAAFVSSNIALTEVPSIYDRSQLDYVVTDYDTSVITVNSISNTGIMNYDVLNINAPLNSYINIVFIIKQ